MDNEKELTTQEEETPKPKKQIKKKSTKKQTTTEPEQQEESITDTTVEPDAAINQDDIQPYQPSQPDATEQQTSAKEDNPTWNFFNNVQTVQTKSSKGGSNHTSSVRRNAQKRIRKAKTQRASRRINRRK